MALGVKSKPCSLYEGSATQLTAIRPLPRMNPVMSPETLLSGKTLPTNITLEHPLLIMRYHMIPQVRTREEPPLTHFTDYILLVQMHVPLMSNQGAFLQGTQPAYPAGRHRYTMFLVHVEQNSLPGKLQRAMLASLLYMHIHHVLC